MRVAFLRRPKFWVVAVPLAGLLAGSVVGNGGLLELWRLRQERDALAASLFELMRENDELRREIVALRKSDRVLERLARRELGVVRDGEIVYRFRARSDETGRLVRRP